MSGAFNSALCKKAGGEGYDRRKTKVDRGGTFARAGGSCVSRPERRDRVFKKGSYYGGV